MHVVKEKMNAHVHVLALNAHLLGPIAARISVKYSLLQIPVQNTLCIRFLHPSRKAFTGKARHLPVVHDIV